MKRNILVVQQDNFGGEQVAVKRLFDAYKKNFPNSVCNYSLLEPFKELNTRSSFLFRLLNYFKLSRLQIFNLLKKNKYNLFITSDYLSALSFYSLGIKNTKMIFLFHGFRSVIFKKVSDINYRQIIIKLLEKLSWILSDAVAVPSNQAKQFHGLSRAFIVQNIVPDKFFVKNPKTKSHKNFTILYSGRLAKSKGLENLVTAFDNISKEIPEAKLFIVYPTIGIDKQVYSNLIALTKNMKYSSKSIKFIVDPSQDELIKLYSNSDVLILPSELEFAPLSIIEAMATGTPVIGTSVGNVGSLLKKLDKNLILKNNSFDEISQKVSLFYNYKRSKKQTLQVKSIKIAESFREGHALKSFKRILNNI